MNFQALVSVSLIFSLLGLFELVKSTNPSCASPPKSEYVLDHEFEINARASLRRYELVITNTTAGPDGFWRTVLAINNQIPGPLIEANEGDSLEITVINHLDSPVTIHWHGLYQNGTNWEDGVTGVTQCPIPGSGGMYIYKFTLTGHAHHQNLMADGISGPLIIHSPRDPLKRGIDFDEDIVLMLTDWYHNTSSQIVEHMLSEPGYFHTPAAPSPNSALVNGVGEWDCRWATTTQRCEKTSPPEFRVLAGHRVRFRLVNAGAHAMFYWSADEHTLNVTEADSTAVYGPSDIHRIKFHNGQRYSVIVKIDSKEAGSSFYLRGTMDSDCWAWVAGDLQRTALAIVRVVESRLDSPRKGTRPTTKDWSDQLDGVCQDLDPNLLSPILPVNVPRTVAGSRTLANAFGFEVISTGAFIPRGGNSSNISPASPAQARIRRQIEVGKSEKRPALGTSTVPPPFTRIGGPPPTPAGARGLFYVDNPVTWKTFPYQPILHDLTPGGTGFIDSTRVANVVYPSADWYDLILVNLDPALSHPYHLHAMDMHLVAFGKGLPPNVENLRNLTYRIENPLRRDTVVIEPASFAIVRILTDIPGIWIM
ncbi:hypothetical protein CROQUDRAFT_66288, partial [Cronartium quercuum f. sp. fusiforme G11]